MNKGRISQGQALLGAYIELKYPAYFNSIGIHVEDLLLKVLRERSIDTIKGASQICPIILQCFELQSLEYMAKFTDLPLVMLLKLGESVNTNISYYANLVNGIGPSMNFVFNSDGTTTDFVQVAHENSLMVHPWTVRDDVPFGNLNRQQLYSAILKSGVDGIFDEFPDSASIYLSPQ